MRAFFFGFLFVVTLIVSDAFAQNCPVPYFPPSNTASIYVDVPHPTPGNLPYSFSVSISGPIVIGGAASYGTNNMNYSYHYDNPSDFLVQMYGEQNSVDPASGVFKSDVFFVLQRFISVDLKDTLRVARFGAEDPEANFLLTVDLSHSEDDIVTVQIKNTGADPAKDIRLELELAGAKYLVDGLPASLGNGQRASVSQRVKMPARIGTYPLISRFSYLNDKTRLSVLNVLSFSSQKKISEDGKCPLKDINLRGKTTVSYEFDSSGEFYLVLPNEIGFTRSIAPGIVTFSLTDNLPGFHSDYGIFGIFEKDLPSGEHSTTICNARLKTLGLNSAVTSGTPYGYLGITLAGLLLAFVLYAAKKTLAHSDEVPPINPRVSSIHVFSCGILVLIVSFFTFVKDYSQPASLFWDENYHIASAQKYLHGVFFMEPHPPLGKMLIALGEKLYGDNINNNEGISVDHIKSIPAGFSFKGYRFLPVLCAWLSTLLVFLIFFQITNSPFQSMFLSLLYAFDNAIIVHSRSAMLEGTQIFFICLTILLCILGLQIKQRTVNITHLLSIFFGIGASFGALVSIKYNGLIVGVLIAYVLVRGTDWRLKSMFRNMTALILGFCLVFLGVWYLHFTLATKIQNTLPNNGYYNASPEYKQLLINQNTSNILAFPQMLKDSFLFTQNYENGVEQLNLCKPGENGSPPWLWPLGGRSINYRWESKEGQNRYLYLQSNPVVWLLGLTGVIGCFSFLLSFFFGQSTNLIGSRGLVLCFTSMYIVYMLVMLHIDRVLYLYHYFIPLIFALILLAYFIREIKCVGSIVVTNRQKTALLGLLSSISFASFIFFSPLSYYRPISDDWFKQRNWFSFWDLRCQNCPLSNKIARPVGDPRIKVANDIFLSGIKADFASQDWGDPKPDVTVEGSDIVINGEKYDSGLGVHANSVLKFRLNNKYRVFKGEVGIPDYVKGKGPSRVVFKVEGDGQTLWASPVMHAGDAVISANVSVSNIATLSLVVEDAGDGISNDHACWLSPQLE